MKPVGRWKRFVQNSGLGALILSLSTVGWAQTLYDAGLGTLPEDQGWGYLAVGNALETVVDQALLLDTGGTTSVHAGWAQAAAVPLNRTNSFTLLFSVRISSEVHNNANRAGFSVIVLGEDQRGIELGFWEDTIFAQADSPLFTHAEDVTFSTTNAAVDYALTMRATNYVLTAGGAPLLSGPIRDYSAFDGFPDPYSTANFLFFGDDTGSAAASIQLRRVALVHPPTLSFSSPGVISWTGVSSQIYTVQSSTNLAEWVAAGIATSSDDLFRFTNSPPQSSQFFRVTFP